MAGDFEKFRYELSLGDHPMQGQVAADLQYVDPALGDTSDAFVAGLRATIRL